MTSRVKSPEEITLIRESALLVSKTLSQMAAMIKPGIKGKALDVAAEEFIRDHDAVPAFKGLNGFPGTLCVSINEEVVHGIPSDREIKPGDIISIDCGVYKNDFFGDSAYTFAIGDVHPKVIKLLKVTKYALDKAIEAARSGNRIGDIGSTVWQIAEVDNKYGVVKELVGHGIGRKLHEPPEVPNFGKKGRGPKLSAGMTLAIEPMINLMSRKVKVLDDGWTIITMDRQPSAHFEHTVVVTDEGGEKLSNHSFVEAEIEKNPHITSI